MGLRIAAALAAGTATIYAVSGVGWRQARTEMQRVPQFENDRVNVWRSVIPPGAESTLHRHGRDRIVIGIVGGDLKTVTAEGRATVTHYETGKAYWQGPMPAGETHKDVNDTAKPIELLVVEMKR